MRYKPYKSDLSDAQWGLLEPLIPPEKPRGRHRSVNLREVVNGIFYVQRTGCSWEMIPHDLPPSSTVYCYFRKWQRSGVWAAMNQQLRYRVRQGFGKDLKPTAVSADSQSVKTAEKRGRSMAMTEVKRPLRGVPRVASGI